MKVVKGEFRPHNGYGFAEPKKAWIVGPLCVHRQPAGMWRVSHAASDKSVLLGIRKRRWAISLAKHLSHYPYWEFQTGAEWNDKFRAKAVAAGVHAQGMLKFLLGLEKQEKARA
jgi:hypothetical protein